MSVKTDSADFWPLINELGEAQVIARERMDELWGEGWRHFGPRFFRYSLMWQEEQWKRVLNLRVPLAEWKPSKSQRRTLRRNEDLQVEFGPAEPGEEEEALFQAHKSRFRENVPDALSDFLGEEPNGVPLPCMQLSVRSGDRLVAASFLDIGLKACSSIYGIFDPAKSQRRLGIFTMLMEMQYAREAGLDFYYLGYACIESSPYDYKKEVKPAWVWDWRQWRPFTPDDCSKQALPIPEGLMAIKRG
ncbi:hypothetical protein [Roseibacillus persicicus]|uniref:hypothetical protein n=1 Tax=Roseibacillus persicicus TaxID=454148 RepID=UPI00280CF92E|nr:hypothetical protein [Roseibacillus persicicus]MDQ8191783.1 hypothetical protein [Roseibacillus persicicus]